MSTDLGPIIIFDTDPTTLALSLPPRRWRPIPRTIGGSETATGGEPASYVLRRDPILAVTLRCDESELDDVLAWIAYAQDTSAIFGVQLRDDLEAVDCYLEHPCAGEDVTPTPEEEAPWVYDIALELRRADGTAWAPRWFPEP